jgi:hypothetical protein
MLTHPALRPGRLVACVVSILVGVSLILTEAALAESGPPQASPDNSSPKGLVVVLEILD